MAQRQAQARTGISRRRFLQSVGLGLGTLALGPLTAWPEEPPIKIGVLAPTIFNFPIGLAMVRGAFIAQDEINARGGVLGRPITVEGLVRDTQFDPRITVQRFEELAEGQKVLAVVGGFLDETTLPVMSLLPRVRTPFLNTGTATPQTSQMVKEDHKNFKFYFRLMLDTEVLTEDTVGLAQGVLVEELGIRRAAIVAEDGGFGRDFRGFLERKLPEAGIEITSSSLFPQTGNFDFSGILSQAEQAGAAAFFVVFIRRNGFGFVRQWYDQGPRLPVAGINVSGQAFEYWGQTQGKVISHTYADAATGATAITEKTLPFFKAYVERFKTPPVQPLYTAYTTYDAFFVLKEAIERLGSPPPTPKDEAAYRQYREELIAALEQTDYVGTVGRVRFQGPDDEKPHSPVLRDPETGEPLVVPKWVQWQSDTGDRKGTPDRKVVWPPEYKNSEFIRPPQP